MSFLHKQISNKVIWCYVIGAVSERTAYLSDMATCSNMADPVLVFQLPDIDVLLSNNTIAGMIQCFKISSNDIAKGIDSIMTLRTNTVVVISYM